VAKLQAEVVVVEQGKRSLEERRNEIGAAEQMCIRELFRLTNLLKIYGDCNSKLKAKICSCLIAAGLYTSAAASKPFRSVLGSLGVMVPIPIALEFSSVVS
jgi:hypothetical protein